MSVKRLQKFVTYLKRRGIISKPIFYTKSDFVVLHVYIIVCCLTDCFVHTIFYKDDKSKKIIFQQTSYVYFLTM